MDLVHPQVRDDTASSPRVPIESRDNRAGFITYAPTKELPIVVPGGFRIEFVNSIDQELLELLALLFVVQLHLNSIHKVYSQVQCERTNRPSPPESYFGTPLTLILQMCIDARVMHKRGKLQLSQECRSIASIWSADAPPFYKDCRSFQQSRTFAFG